MSFINNPNIPTSKVNTVVVGERYSMLTEPLKALNISCIQVPDNLSVDPRLAGHADLSFLHLGGKNAVISKSVPGLAAIAEANGFEIEFAKKDQDMIYPADCNLNACIINEFILCREDITEARAKLGRTILAVRQGYAKCSVCVVDETHIISDDEGIFKTAKTAGIDCLLIRKGFIELVGFDHGFIGGCTGKLAPDKLAFTGSLKNHPDEKKILDYLRECAVEPIFLTNEPCFDAGSILPVKTVENCRL